MAKEAPETLGTTSRRCRRNWWPVKTGNSALAVVPEQVERWQNSPLAGKESNEEAKAVNLIRGQSVCGLEVLSWKHYRQGREPKMDHLPFANVFSIDLMILYDSYIDVLIGKWLI